MLYLVSTSVEDKDDGRLLIEGGGGRPDGRQRPLLPLVKL